MKKTDKSTDKNKKKSGKKKNAKAAGAFDFNSKQLQKEFNKRMKVLVGEVKKDTDKTIKALMKEAKLKIHASSEFIRNDVLKSIVAQYESVVGPDTADVKPARKTRVKTAAEAVPAAETAALPAALVKGGTRAAKSTATAGNKRSSTAKTRKTAAAASGTDSNGQDHAS
jgi:hypothetical protein